jgi:hypothetical protein
MGMPFYKKWLSFLFFFRIFYFNQGLGKLSKNFHDNWLKYHLISIAKKITKGAEYHHSDRVWL